MRSATTTPARRSRLTAPLVCLFMSLLTSAGSAAPRYAAVAYRAPPKGARPTPEYPRWFIARVTASGKAAGKAWLNEREVVALRWDVPDKVIVLKSSDGTPVEEVLGVHESGAVVGATLPRGDHKLRPVQWDATGTMSVFSLPAAVQHSVAAGINAHGQVIGHDRAYGGAIVLWDASGKPATLAMPLNAKGCEAHAINDNGEIAGSALVYRLPLDPGRSTTDPHAVRWDKQGKPHLLAVPERLSNGLGHGIGNAGHVVGRAARRSGQWEAIRWSPTGEPAVLGRPDGPGTEAVAFVVDEQGTAYGYVRDPNFGPFRAVLWEADGKHQYLDDLLDESGNGRRLNGVQHVNGRYVVAYAVNSLGHTEPVVLRRIDGKAP